MAFLTDISMTTRARIAIRLASVCTGSKRKLVEVSRQARASMPPYSATRIVHICLEFQMHDALMQDPIFDM